MRFRPKSLGGTTYGKGTPLVSTNADERCWIPLRDVEVSAGGVGKGDGDEGEVGCGMGIMVERTFANVRAEV